MLQESLPVRGAWIEIALCECNPVLYQSLPVRGAWIEIKNIALIYVCRCSRSPCGERGLKCPQNQLTVSSQ